MEINVVYHYEDSGFCRVVYKRTNTERELLICKQGTERHGYEWFTCSKDGEADCPIRADVKINEVNKKGEFIKVLKDIGEGRPKTGGEL